MPAYTVSPETFTGLKGQVVVLTGGANGVGECAVRTLVQVGAHVVFGDIDEAKCAAVADDLARTTAAAASGGSVAWRKLDARCYEDNLALFDAAMAKHGRVDHALSFAGITEGPNWFEADLDLASVRAVPSAAVLDVNLLGTLYFTRIAAVYLRQGKKEGGVDKSIFLTGSIASFAEQAGLFVYSASKHGVMGLFRGVRRNLHDLHGIRMNMACPCLIATAMATKVHHLWADNGLPINQPQAVADLALDLTVSQKHGQAVFIEGDQAWEIEADLERLQSAWMGPDGARNLVEINKVLGVGTGWTAKTPAGK